jgi:hypothetical protein
MLHIVEPVIILSSLLQPAFVVPQKPIDYYHYEIVEPSPLPPQNINDVLTSEEMLMHIINEIKFDAR